MLCGCGHTIYYGVREYILSSFGCHVVVLTAKNSLPRALIKASHRPTTLVLSALELGWSFISLSSSRYLALSQCQVIESCLSCAATVSVFVQKCWLRVCGAAGSDNCYRVLIAPFLLLAGFCCSVSARVLLCGFLLLFFLLLRTIDCMWLTLLHCVFSFCAAE